MLLPVFETVIQCSNVPLVLTIMSNAIRLKFGSRLTPPAVELFFKYLFGAIENPSVAETLSLLVYFKQAACSKLLDKKFWHKLVTLELAQVQDYH